MFSLWVRHTTATHHCGGLGSGSNAATHGQVNISERLFTHRLYGWTYIRRLSTPSSNPVRGLMRGWSNVLCSISKRPELDTQWSKGVTNVALSPDRTYTWTPSRIRISIHQEIGIVAERCSSGGDGTLTRVTVWASHAVKMRT
jgi:hypothetical protein